jgi:hypothetical protein
LYRGLFFFRFFWGCCELQCQQLHVLEGVFFDFLLMIHAPVDFISICGYMALILICLIYRVDSLQTEHGQWFKYYGTM